MDAESRAPIAKTFAHHAPTDHALNKIRELRHGFSNMKTLIELACPASHERSVALTELETSAMWAIKSIVTNDPESIVES
jgi:hypothetical protein